MLGQLEIFFFIFVLIQKKKRTCQAIKQIETGREKVGLARFSLGTTQHNTSNSHEYPEAAHLLLNWINGSCSINAFNLITPTCSMSNCSFNLAVIL